MKIKRFVFIEFFLSNNNNNENDDDDDKLTLLLSGITINKYDRKFKLLIF